MALDYTKLPDDTEQLKQMLLQQSAWVESLKAEVLRLRRWQFGRSSEAIDLSVAPGEVVALLGPSGSGKCRAPLVRNRRQRARSRSAASRGHRCRQN